MVDHLLRSRGTVEPMIVNHDQEKWAEFLKATGRDVQNTGGRLARQLVVESFLFYLSIHVDCFQRDWGDSEKTIFLEEQSSI